MKPNWAERKVLECAGLDPETAQDWEVYLASQCLAQFYYIDRAADAFLERLRLPTWRVVQ